MEQNSSYWATMEFTQGFVSWSGNAFEMVAHNHIPQIKSALGISGVKTDTYYWRTKADNGNLGAQIDLLIKRADKTVTIVECKYYNLTLRTLQLLKLQISHPICSNKKFCSHSEVIKMVFDF